MPWISIRPCTSQVKVSYSWVVGTTSVTLHAVSVQWAAHTQGYLFTLNYVVHYLNPVKRHKVKLEIGV